MRIRIALMAAALVSSSLLSGASAASEPKLLNRSIYLPIEFTLCEHLGGAVLYQDDEPISKMPAKRVFQFTYYPELSRMLPEVVQIRVEGTYREDGSPFVARLAVTPSGIHTARATKAFEPDDLPRGQKHKIDRRFEPRVLRLACERYCSHARKVARVGGDPVR